MYSTYEHIKLQRGEGPAHGMQLARGRQKATPVRLLDPKVILPAPCSGPEERGAEGQQQGRSHMACSSLDFEVLLCKGALALTLKCA